MKKNKGWAWLCHHKELLEYCDDFAGRVRYIKDNKPACEIPTRLNAFTFVKGKLPIKLVKAWLTEKKARANYDKAWLIEKKAWRTEKKETWANCEKAKANNAKACANCEEAWWNCEKARANCEKEARVNYVKAFANCEKAWANCEKAKANYKKIYKENMPKLLALFKTECPDVKWDEKRQTLLFEREKNEKMDCNNYDYVPV